MAGRRSFFNFSKQHHQPYQEQRAPQNQINQKNTNQESQYCLRLPNPFFNTLHLLKMIQIQVISMIQIQVIPMMMPNEQ
jgi:hypothetical protein